MKLTLKPIVQTAYTLELSENEVSVLAFIAAHPMAITTALTEASRDPRVGVVRPLLQDLSGVLSNR